MNILTGLLERYQISKNRIPVEKQHVWIASHIHHPCRVRSLTETIKSIAAQEMSPSLVAMSFSLCSNLVHARQDVEHIFDKYLSPRGIRYMLLYQPCRKYQFEHLEYIYDAVVTKRGSDPRYIIVSFCDDDDVLGPERVRTADEMISGKGNDAIQSSFYIMAHFSSENTSYEEAIAYASAGKYSVSTYSELGCVSCRASFFRDFLNQRHVLLPPNSNPQILDMFFKGFLTRSPIKMVTLYDKPLYYRRYYNTPNKKIWTFSRKHTESLQTQQFIKALDEWVLSLTYRVDKDGGTFLVENARCPFTGKVSCIRTKQDLKDVFIMDWHIFQEKVSNKIQRQIDSSRFIQTHETYKRLIKIRDEDDNVALSSQ